MTRTPVSACLQLALACGILGGLYAWLGALLLLVMLVHAAHHQWRHEPANRRAAHIAAAVRRAHDDDRQCELCRAVTPSREVIPLTDDAMLLCRDCKGLFVDSVAA